MNAEDTTAPDTSTRNNAQRRFSPAPAPSITNTIIESHQDLSRQSSIKQAPLPLKTFSGRKSFAFAAAMLTQKNSIAENRKLSTKNSLSRKNSVSGFGFVPGSGFGRGPGGSHPSRSPSSRRQSPKQQQQQQQEGTEGRNSFDSGSFVEDESNRGSISVSFLTNPTHTHRSADDSSRDDYPDSDTGTMDTFTSGSQNGQNGGQRGKKPKMVSKTQLIESTDGSGMTLNRSKGDKGWVKSITSMRDKLLEGKLSRADERKKMVENSRGSSRSGSSNSKKNSQRNLFAVTTKPKAPLTSSRKSVDTNKAWTAQGHGQGQGQGHGHGQGQERKVSEGMSGIAPTVANANHKLSINDGHGHGRPGDNHHHHHNHQNPTGTDTTAQRGSTVTSIKLKKKKKLTKAEEERMLQKATNYRQVMYLEKNTHFDAAEIRVLQEMFKVYSNSTKHGSLDRLLFRDIMIKMFGIWNDEMLNRIYYFFDSDAEGSISDTEWIQNLSVFLRGTMEQQISFVYDTYDINGDHGISREELTTLLRGCLINLPAHEDEECFREIVELAMKLLDVDRTGVITPESFKTAVLRDPLLLQSLGPCLPVEKYLKTFMTLLSDNYLNYSTNYSLPHDPAYNIRSKILMSRVSLFFRQSHHGHSNNGRSNKSKSAFGG